MGRPPSHSAVGVDVGGTKVAALAPFVVPVRTARDGTGPETTAEQLAAFVRRFVGAGAAARPPLGIAVPGLVSEEGVVVACDVLPQIAGWRPAEALGDLGAPVAVVNDAEAALWAETAAHEPGAPVGVVMAGTAIGAAFRVNGTVLHGASRAAGEIGYLPLVVGEEPRRLDEVAGGAALAARLSTDGAGVARRAEAGDPEAQRAVEDAGAMLGLGLAAVLNVFNLSALAVGGGLLQLPGYFQAALRLAEQHTLPEAWAACDVRRAAPDAVARGAARIAAMQAAGTTNLS